MSKKFYQLYDKYMFLVSSIRIERQCISVNRERGIADHTGSTGYLRQSLEIPRWGEQRYLGPRFVYAHLHPPEGVRAARLCPVPPRRFCDGVCLQRRQLAGQAIQAQLPTTCQNRQRHRMREACETPETTCGDSAGLDPSHYVRGPLRSD